MRVFCWWWGVSPDLQSCWQSLIKREYHVQPRFCVCQKQKYYCSFSLNSEKQLFPLLASLVLNSSKIYVNQLRHWKQMVERIGIEKISPFLFKYTLFFLGKKRLSRSVDKNIPNEDSDFFKVSKKYNRSVFERSLV